MTGVMDVQERLSRLRELRERIDLEIQALEDRNREVLARFKRARREAELKERRTLRALDEAALREQAPAHMVREWAAREGIPCSANGKVPDALREQYLAAKGISA